MNYGKTIFSQIVEFMPLYEFRKCVKRYKGDYKVKSFSCMDQFLCMAFAQLTYRESLRDIESCLRSMHSKLYHMGFRGQISRNTISHANNHRNWRIYADFAQVLIHQARLLYQDEPFGVELRQTAYALDSTTIDLCLRLFPWAYFRKNKGAVKLHTLLDLHGNIPVFIDITCGKIHDINILDYLIIEAGSFYIMDRGYLDFKRLYTLHQQRAFFITRTKSNFRYRRLYSKAVEKITGLRCDQTITLAGYYSARDCPEKLRFIRSLDKDGKRLAFLTNNFTLDALTITELYRCRWQIELFFRWIKQHLRIKTFFGTSENAVKTQIWIAVSVYIIVAIIKKRLNLKPSLYTILQIFSVTIFEKTSILQALLEADIVEQKSKNHNQLTLFEL